uniref:B2 bradykinin receptor n=1 Tax=Periophthalmus magnuspinnatus TaxID=409849 RepID=A0A3B4AMF8_9GOBI
MHFVGYSNFFGHHSLDKTFFLKINAVLHIYIFIISALGIFLNIFVLLVFSLHKKPCTVAEIYLSNLAAADLILVSCLPFWAINIYNNYQWPFGSFMCKVVNLGIKMNNLCSIYFLVLVSIDRYIALVHAMSYGRMRRPKYAKIGCLIVWIFGLILESPVLIFRKVEYIPDYDVTACIIDYPSVEFSQFCDIMLTIISFLIPICIIAYCTLRIIQALSNKSMDRFHTERVERKAAFLVLIVLAVFIVCWLPYQVFIFLDTLDHYNLLTGCEWDDVLDIGEQLATYIGYSNCSLNPFLYVIVGKQFKQRAKDVLRFVLCKRWERGRSGYSNSNVTSRQCETTKI